MAFLFCIKVSYANTYHELYGHVYDSRTLKPVENAEIKINSNITKTDKDGLFTFSNIEIPQFDIIIYHPNYEEKTFSVNLQNDSILKFDFYIDKISFQTPIITVEDEIQIKGYGDLLEITSVLEGKELERNIGLTLANTLKNESGISLRSMGPAPSRPVFRGLSGERIFISEDGNKTLDLSSTSPDHSVALESFTGNRIEVFRGPKILSKTSNPNGGIINIVRNDIPLKKFSSINGVIGAYGETVNSGYLGSAVLKIPLDNFSAYLEGSYRKTSDIETPIGILNNTEIQSHNFSGGLGYIAKSFLTGVNFRQYNSKYGIPGGFIGAHPNGVDIELKKRQLNGKIVFPSPGSSFSDININFINSYFYQREYELDNIIGAEFELNEYAIDFDLTKENFLNFDDSETGSGFEYKNFKIGGFVFTPPIKSYKGFIFDYEKKEIGNIILEGAFRYEYNTIQPDQDLRFTTAQFPQRNFNIFSASLSGVYKLSSDFLVSLNLNRSSRAPSIEELFSQGPHLAAYTYEVGNPDLNAEVGYGAELSGMLQLSDFYLTANLFTNNYSYFITSRNTGDTNYQTLLPIYASMGTPALFYGFEIQSEIPLMKHIVFSASVNYTYGEFKDTGKPLPDIPPLKSLIELKYENENFLIGINSEIAASQNRVDEFEQPTKGYAVWNGYIQSSFFTGKFIHNVSLSIDNIFNKEYRNHLSRVKSIMPEAGRDLRIVYKFIF